MTSALRFLLKGLLWLVILIATLWAVGAIWYDLPYAALRAPLAIIYGLLMAGLMFVRRWRVMGIPAVPVAGFCMILICWSTITPKEDLDWQADVAKTAYAKIDGDRVEIHNIRHCDYRTELDYTVHWKTRTIDLHKVTGIDLAVNYWGSPAIAHTIMSFQIEGEEPLAISIETRKQVGQSYSTIAGFYRQYGLIYVVSDERDLIRVRTNYRHGETVFLYRLRVPPVRARAILLSYLHRINELHEHPAFYNALTKNCTTSIRVHVEATAAHPDPWDWRILLNGYLDEMLYEKGGLVGEGPFAELKARSEVKKAALAIGDASDFSAQIRRAISMPPEPVFTAQNADVLAPKESTPHSGETP